MAVVGKPFVIYFTIAIQEEEAVLKQWNFRILKVRAACPNCAGLFEEVAGYCPHGFSPN
jgi:hypothetical protein